MLIILTVVFAVVGVILLFKKQHVLGITLLVSMLICQSFILLDANKHYGTSKYTATQTEQIAPVANIKGNKILVKEKIKQGKTEYQAYATKTPGKSEIHTVLNKQKTVKINTDSNDSNKEIKNIKYRYNDTIQKLLFTGITNSGQLSSQEITYNLNSNWHIVTKSQLKRAGKVLKEPKTQLAIKQDVENDVHNQIKTDPTLAKNPANLKKLEDKALTKAVGNVIDSAK
ncbi:DUF4811 domain-containing protein [Companilactobacillus mishanensis]|uniref:DUF4811 domain-containing protein n=1 Tax=Companilactobacillus mishanensis TaxID=2486008 RepID=A0ABW9P7Y1_9LACO|nr:DUF4811 domain-containing protein [Companilactobacillus mishanensis]MQS45052.1 DUF4811 domain-containing protein [Companilactobacillus mishanensis]